MNMFFHELKEYRKSTIAWTVTLIALIILFMPMFTSFSKDVENFKKVLAGYPQPVLKAVGISMENFFSLLGFYSYIFAYVVLCGSIQAMNLGTSIISKESRAKTADFLMTKPVTRQQIMTSKLLAAFVSIVITDVFYLISASIVANIVKNQSFDFKIFIMISLTLFFVQLIFLALGAAVSVTVSKIKSVLPISLCTVFGFYIINMLGSVIGEKNLRYITPFKYYDSMYIIKNAAYEGRFMLLELVIITVLIVYSYIYYMKKDIHAV